MEPMFLLLSKTLTRNDLEKLECWKEPELTMIFCILDTATVYDNVVKAFQALRGVGVNDRNDLKSLGREKIEQVLRSVGYRWPKQKAGYLTEFANNPIDITTASRDELVKSVKGISWKLASMYLRNTRGLDLAVIDIHIKRWLKRVGYDIKQPYHILEGYMKREAYNKNMTVAYLDYLIWESSRVKR